MSPRRPRTASLAARIVALTLVVVGVTVVLSSTIALVGVYRTMQAEEATRLIADRQIVVEGLDGRLGTAAHVIDSLAGALGAHPLDRIAASRTLDTAVQANAETFDLIALTQASGTVVAAVPFQDWSRLERAAVLSHAATAGGRAQVFEILPGGTKAGRVWVAEAFTAGGSRLLLLARLRTGIRRGLVDDVDSAAEHRAAVIVDAAGRTVVAGKDGPPLDLSHAVFSSDGLHAGTTAGLVSNGIGPMRGYWSALDVTGLDWRVVVAEPRTTAMMRARASLLPASLIMLFAAAMAMGIATVFARHLVQPLHEFEGRARAVVSGRTVGPLDSERADEIGRLADAFDAMVVRLNALGELSRLLARSSRMDEVLRGTLAATTRLLGPEVVPAVFLLDRPRAVLSLAAVPASGDLPDKAEVPAEGDLWPATALHATEPVTFGPGSVPPAGPAHAFAAAGIRSGLALPLVVSDEPLGVLAVLSREGAEFSEAERETLWTFATAAALAIENSRLFEEELRSRREADALRKVAEMLENPAELRESLVHVGGLAAELLDASCRRLAFGDDIAGLDELRDPEFQGWDALYASRESADLHMPVVIPADEPVPVLLGTSHSPVMLIPLLQGGVRRGLFVLDRPDTADDFTRGQMRLAATIGREVSLALDNAFLLHQAQQRALTLDTIFRISQALGSSLQSNVVLNRVLDVVQKILTADAVSLMTYDVQRHVIATAMARGILDREMLYFETVPGDDMPGAVFAGGRAEVFRGLEEADTRLARLAHRSGSRSLLCVPLLARGRSTGVLSVYSSDPHAFDTQDVELLQTFASQAALALDTAQLYGREHEVASILQRSILPERLPRSPGLEVASVYRPAGQEAEIGGDYFDLFPAPDGRVVLVIADVVGKGVLAATKTSMIRYSLRGMVAAGLGPAGCVSELNRMVAESGDPSEIVTLWVGFLDVAERTLRFADAGHPPALVLQPRARDVARLMPTGPVLGAVASAAYREERSDLEDGSMILLYTDGVTEARRNGRFFGEARVRRVLRAGGTAQETADRLMRSVDRFTDGALRDDAAVLIVRLHATRDSE